MIQPGQNFGYLYDDLGNIVRENHNGLETTYVYDGLSQLIRVNDPHRNKTIQYEYDRGGNILSRTEHPYTTGTPGQALDTASYTYGDANWKDKLTAYNGTPITYDEIGNPLDDGTWTYTWKVGRQLARMTGTGDTVDFTYNADGLRVRKESAVRGVTEYILSGKQITHLTRKEDGPLLTEMHFWYDAQGKAAMVSYNGNDYVYVYNAQGDVVALLDKANHHIQVVAYAYDPWGKQVACTGTMANTLGVENPFRYRGYVFDVETGLYYLRSRYYNSEWRRFLNSDALLENTAGVLSHNVFVYCRNNPVMLSDPTGLSFVSALKGMVDTMKKVETTVREMKRQAFNLASLASAAPGALALLTSDLGYRNEGYEDGDICCAYGVYHARGQKGHLGATLIYEEDLIEKRRFSSIDELEPKMLIFKDTGKTEQRTYRGYRTHVR